jgi:hypothetical protein
MGRDARQARSASPVGTSPGATALAMLTATPWLEDVISNLVKPVPDASDVVSGWASGGVGR